MTSIRRRLGLSANHPAQTCWALLGLALCFATSVALTPTPAPTSAAPIVQAVANPASLSATDSALYKMIYAAEEANDHTGANALIAQLSNRLLVGNVLAQRYLNSHYKVSVQELDHWLEAYADHPRASRIARLAMSKGVKTPLTDGSQPLRGEGYTDHMGRSGMPDAWFTALGRWREGDVAAAKTIFVKLSADEALSDWQRSAAYYWAYRAADRLGDTDLAAQSLLSAAHYPTTFYGLLAAEQSGDLDITAEAPKVSSHLRSDPHAIRAALLSSLGRNDDAEDELRLLYSTIDKTMRPGIITLASEMGLSNLQVRLARTPGLSAREALFANYPMPQFMMQLHPVMDPALLLAVARNESSFRDSAASGAGAVGMMQMLPSTARAVERHVGREMLSVASADNSNAPLAERLNDPAMSARYGAEYLKLLTKQPAIGNNLVRLLVGYNAGPGTVANWQSASRNVSDPLLYIESIPYPETRNYVMQVSAQYWVYQLMMDEKPTTLSAMARGQWPTLPVKAGA
ncbi:MAG: lytic transglycosylase domain-containing protein [Pseudomonadota bacterium]